MLIDSCVCVVRAVLCRLTAVCVLCVQSCLEEMDSNRFRLESLGDQIKKLHAVCDEEEWSSQLLELNELWERTYSLLGKLRHKHSVSSPLLKFSFNLLCI